MMKIQTHQSRIKSTTRGPPFPHHPNSNSNSKKFHPSSQPWIIILVFITFCYFINLIPISEGNSMQECQVNKEFKCKSSGQCIPLSQRLDGHSDCPDGSDEDCSPLGISFKCKCGFPICVPLSSVKDGVYDCADGSDEGLIFGCKLGEALLKKSLRRRRRNAPDLREPFTTTVAAPSTMTMDMTIPSKEPLIEILTFEPLVESGHEMHSTSTATSPTFEEFETFSQTDNSRNPDDDESNLRSELEATTTMIISTRMAAIPTPDLVTEKLKTKKVDSSPITEEKSAALGSSSMSSSSSAITRKTGLVSSQIQSQINDGFRTTFVIREIFGTFVGPIYAHLAKTRTTVVNSGQNPFTSESIPSESQSQLPSLSSSSSLLPSPSFSLSTTTTNPVPLTAVGTTVEQLLSSTSLPSKAESQPISNSEPNTATSLAKNSISVESFNELLPTSSTSSTPSSTALEQLTLTTSIPSLSSEESSITIEPTKVMSVDSESNREEESEGEEPVAVTLVRPTGVIGKTIRTEINEGKTTVLTNEILGTFINGIYAHFNRVSTTVLEPSLKVTEGSQSMQTSIVTPSLETTRVTQTVATPFSVSLSTEVNQELVTFHTANVFRTMIDGFPAQYTKLVSNIQSIKNYSISSTTSTKTSSKPSVHFPTPVRKRKTSTLVETITKTITATTSVIDLMTANAIDESKEIGFLHNNTIAGNVYHGNNNSENQDADEDDQENNEDYYADESEMNKGMDYYEKDSHRDNESLPDTEYPEENRPQKARHRPPRDESRKPLVFDDDVEDNGQNEPSNSPQNRRAFQTRRYGSIFGRRMTANANQNEPEPIIDKPEQETRRRDPFNNYREPASRRESLTTEASSVERSDRITPGNRRFSGHRRYTSPPATTQRPEPTRGRTFAQNPRLNRFRARLRNTNGATPATPATQAPVTRAPTRRPFGRGRVNQNQNQNPSRRVRQRRPNSQQRNQRQRMRVLEPSLYTAETISTTSEQQRQTYTVDRRQNGGKTKRIYLQQHQHTTSQTQQPQYQYTQQLPQQLQQPNLPQLGNTGITLDVQKTPITVTSLVDVTRTIPIHHGFQTSYATITTSTFSSSTIQPDQYQVTIDPKQPDHSVTVLTRSTDLFDPTRVTEVVVVKTMLNEIKLVPIRIGYSTRTDTLTTIHMLTLLSTSVSTLPPPVVHTPPSQVIGPNGFLTQPLLQQQPSFTFLTTSSTYVTTSTIISTTVVSLLLQGKTLLSTLTNTKFAESTVIAMHTIPVQVTNPAPVLVPIQPTHVPLALTTLLTLTLTGEGGDVTELLTEITLPGAPGAGAGPAPYHTKVERDIRGTRTAEAAAQVLFATRAPSGISEACGGACGSGSPSGYGYGAGYGVNAPIAAAAPSFASSSSSSGANFGSLSASFSLPEETLSKRETPNYITTVFKGPTKEVYKASATVLKEVKHYDAAAVDQRKMRKPDDGKQKKKAAKNRYATGSFRGRRLQQFEDYTFNFAPELEILRDFTRVTQIHSLPTVANQYPPEVPIGPVGGYQRVRLQDPNNVLGLSQPNQVTRNRGTVRRRRPVQPGNNVSQNPPQGVRFQRVVARKPDVTPAVSAAPAPPQQQGNFRRVPVFSNDQIPPPQPQSQPQFHEPPTNPDTNINPQRQSQNQNGRPHKRVRVPQNGGPQNGRPVKKIKITVPVTPPSPVTVEDHYPTLIVKPEAVAPHVLETRVNSRPVVEQPPPVAITVSDVTTAPPKRIVRVRRPSTLGFGPRRIVLKGNRIPSRGTQGRGPVPPKSVEEEPNRNNALDLHDNIVGHESKIKDDVSLLRGTGPESVVLKYLTRFTYMTTVIRGQHTLFTNRESKTSSLATSSLDAGLLDLIEKSKGVLPDSTVLNLGTKTKGPTTTIVNLHTDVSIANVEPLKIEPTKTVAHNNIQERRTKVVRRPVYEQRDPQADAGVPRVDAKQLLNVPKTYYTQFVYYYTVYDQINTKKSTRSEVVSTIVNTPNIIENLKVDRTVDSDGFISLGSGPETVNLGKRAFGGSTTEVNLAMQSFLRLDGVSNVVVSPEETSAPTVNPSTLNPSTPPTEWPSSSSASPFLETSFSQELPKASTVATPSIASSLENRVPGRTRKPVRVSSSEAIREHNGPVRSRIRVRTRRPPQPPVQTENLTPNVLLESTPVYIPESLPVSPEFVSSFEDTTPPLSSPSIEPSRVFASRRPPAVTIRKPFGGLHRVRTRRPNRPQATAEPKLVVVTRSGPVGQVRPTGQQRFRIASRVIRPQSSEFEPEESPVFTSDSVSPTPTVSSQQPFTSTLSVNEKGETVSIGITTVPVIFGLDTSYRTITLTSTLDKNHASSTPALQSSQLSNKKPSTVVITYMTTSTQTIPFTVGNYTLYTTFEVTNSHTVTETIPPESISGHRANKYTKASNGVTLIVSDNQKHTPGIGSIEPTAAVTLDPTLVTGASVVMKDAIERQEAKQFETITLYTTFTYFTTYYQETTSVVSSSEKIVSNLVTVPVTDITRTSGPEMEITRAPGESQVAAAPEKPITVVETTEKTEFSTLTSTQTFFATLFNGTDSTITPIEETKTEILTLREPLTITKTIYPSSVGSGFGSTSAPQQDESVFTRTYYTTYTNMITYYENETPTTKEVKETETNIVTFTVPKNQLSTGAPSPASANVPSLRTRVTSTTLTHFITLFSGSNTILSSIEEVSPTTITELLEPTQSPGSIHHHQHQPGHFQRTRGSQYLQKSSRDLMTAFVPSVSTYSTMHTHYTTFFSGTTSIISSTVETSTSLVTLYVPYSMVQPTSTVDPVLTMYTTYTLDSTGPDDQVTKVESTATNYVTVSATPSLPSRQEFILSSFTEPLESVSFYEGKLSSASQLPSLRVESSRYEELESSVISRVVADLKSSQGLSEDQISSVISSAGIGKSTTVIGGSTVVFFTDLFFKPDINPTGAFDGLKPTLDSNHVAKGPVGNEANSLLDQKDISSIVDQLQSQKHLFQTDGVNLDPGHGIIPTAAGAGAGGSAPTIKPGATLELSDLLGNKPTGNLGAAIKDIVHLIAKGANKYQQAKQKNASNIDRLETSKVLLPSGIVTLSHSEDPIYIPLGTVDKGSSGSSRNEGQPRPPIAPVFKPKVLPTPTHVPNNQATFKHPVYTPPAREIQPDKSESSETTETVAPVYKKPSGDNLHGARDGGTTPPARTTSYVRKVSDKNDENDNEKEERIGTEKSPLSSSIGSDSEIQSSATIRPTPSLDLETTLQNGDQNQQGPQKAIYTEVTSGATTLFLVDATDVDPADKTRNPDEDEKQKSTRYVTSVEPSTRTLTLTTTKVYYTRDSPLTITSEFTTTIPPRTYVSTIIGSRTILGTAGEPTKTQDIEATQAQKEATTTVTTTTLIFNSITTTVVRTLVIPSTIEPTKPVAAASNTKIVAHQRPTRKPYEPFRGKPKPTRAPSAVSIKPAGPKTRAPYVYKRPTLPPGYETRTPITDNPLNTETTTPRKPVKILDDDQCRPACNGANNEVCKEMSGKYKCECRHGFVKKEGSTTCEEVQSYIVLVRVMKFNETPVSFKSEYMNRKSSEFKELAEMTKNEIDKAYKVTSIKSNYIGSAVNLINKTLDGGVLVNLTVQLADSDEINEEVLLDELSKSLEEAESLPVPSYINAEVQKVQDLDECRDPAYHDCDPSARCINEIGSYKCECKDGFPDLNPSLPGRSCAAEIKNCDLCHSRGDCVRDNNSDSIVCRCQRMYLGRHCEINGILLATVLPAAAILAIISVCCVVYCCRKYRKRSNYSKGFKNIVSFAPPTIGANTLDRKAMLETSSESSEHFRPHVYDGPGAVPGEHPSHSGGSARRPRSEQSLERNLSGHLPPQPPVMGGPSYNMPPQVVIPRARHPNQVNYAIHRGQVYMW